LRKTWAKLSIVTFTLTALVAFVVLSVSGVVIADDPVYYNVTVDQTIYGCCNATINGTEVGVDTTVNVTVEGNTTFSINATFNATNCNWFWEWWDPANLETHANVTDPFSVNTTMNISDNTSLSAICDYFPTSPPLPTTVPVDYDTVEYSEEYMLVGFPYQRQNFAIDNEDGTGLHWAFYINSSAGDGGALCYRTSADGHDWSAQTELKDYANDYGYWPNYNGSSFSIWYDDTYNTVDIAFVNKSDSMLGDTLVYLRGTPLTNGSLVEADDWQIVYDEISTQIMGPSICTNSTGYPFIGATVYAWGDGGYGVMAFHSGTNDGTWTEHADFPMIDLGGEEGSYDQWVSVIPVTAGNVSLQYTSMYSMDGGYWYMAQNYLTHDGADSWTLGDTNWISLSYRLMEWQFMWPGPYHSEVHVPTEYNADDIFMVFNSYDGENVDLVFDTANDPESIWDNGYEDSLSNESYVAAMSIFDEDNNLVLTLNDMRNQGPLFSCPFDLDTYTWGNITQILSEEEAESYDDWIVAAYKHAIPLGFMWDYSPDEETWDLDYGWYGDWDEWWDNPSSDFPCWILWFILPLIVAVATLIYCLKTISDNLTLQNAATTMAIVVIVGFITFLIVKALLGNCGG